mmetsp:Transcript_90028/g.239195  ORF Transcript_90028/g.239195 Transcript_90028/m.239195 type:complete len:98 (+) Transcript_90028:106-399(+)
MDSHPRRQRPDSNPDVVFPLHPSRADAFLGLFVSIKMPVVQTPVVSMVIHNIRNHGIIIRRTAVCEKSLTSVSHTQASVLAMPEFQADVIMRVSYGV